jgi:hypothetical protein
MAKIYMMTFNKIIRAILKGLIIGFGMENNFNSSNKCINLVLSKMAELYSQ